MSGFKKYWIFGGILLLGYFVLQYFKPKPTDWKTTYLSEDKIPFGTYILRQRVHDIFPNAKIEVVQEPIYNILKKRGADSSNLFIIAPNFNIDQLDYREMVKFMKGGGNVFLAVNQIKGGMLSRLKLNIESDYDVRRERKYPINFVNQKLRRAQDYYFNKGISDQYFGRVDTAKAIILGKRNDKEANFIQYNFGKGALFILPNPHLLTNYSLLTADGRDYCAKALSYLPKSDRLIWNDYFIRPNTTDTSPLRVFFQYRELRWAYYIALFSLVIFVVFEMKRRQRVIPLISPLRNTSAEFVEVVGRVYYQQRNNRDIAEKKVSYLLEYLRNKYRIKTTDFNTRFKETLISVSSATPEIVEALFNEVVALQGDYKVSDQQLIGLNKLMEQFYMQDQ